jgi:hypothetical protein
LRRLSAVDVEVCVAQHFAAVGAHVGEVTTGEALDLCDEATVALALVETGLGVLDQIRKDHGNHPSAAAHPAAG